MPVTKDYARNFEFSIGVCKHSKVCSLHKISTGASAIALGWATYGISVLNMSIVVLEFWTRWFFFRNFALRKGSRDASGHARLVQARPCAGDPQDPYLNPGAGVLGFYGFG